jgi:hypothetical protein
MGFMNANQSLTVSPFLAMALRIDRVHLRLIVNSGPVTTAQSDHDRKLCGESLY